jgi:cold shock CspA family protein
MKQGRISKWIREKQAGFIRPDDEGADVYFRATGVCNLEQIEFLAAGMVVEFRPATNDLGPCSYHVVVYLPEAA